VTVVLLHALPLDERMWEPQREALAGQDVVAPRLYDLGGSMDAWADAVLGLFEGPAVLVGASMGGYAALAVARRAPERVAGLVLAGSRPDADAAERRAGRAETIALIRGHGPLGLWESMRPKLFPPGADPEVVARARALALEQQAGGLVRAVEAIRDRPDSTGAFEALGDRALVVLGEADPFVAADEIASSRVHVLPGGHLPSMERASEFNVLVGEALQRWT
jgi:pimeloyl-ACP methyl ester carboxylesterase